MLGGVVERIVDGAHHAGKRQWAVDRHADVSGSRGGRRANLSGAGRRRIATLNLIAVAFNGTMTVTGNVTDDLVIPPFLTGCVRRIHAAIFSFRAGVMPPVPMLGRSLLQVHNQRVA